MKVLLENVSEKDESMLAGYTDTMKLVNVKADKKYIGKIVNVKITDAKTWSLDGKIDEWYRRKNRWVIWWFWKV